MQVVTWNRGVTPFTCSLKSFLNIFWCLCFSLQLHTAPIVPTTLTGKPWIAVWVLSRSMRWKSQLRYTLCSPNFLRPKRVWRLLPHLLEGWQGKLVSNPLRTPSLVQLEHWVVRLVCFLFPLIISNASSKCQRGFLTLRDIIVVSTRQSRHDLLFYLCNSY